MECQNCAFDPFVKALAELIRVYPVTENGKNIQLNAMEYLVYRTRKTNKKVSKAASDILVPFGKLVNFIECEILPKAQEVCIACARSSDDDNLSRGGQTMVFLDAMPGGAAGDLAGDAGNHEEEEEKSLPEDKFFEDSDEDDAETTGGNWINKNAIRRGKDSTDGGVSMLPVAVENEVKTIMASFSKLTPLQQIVLLLRWNEMSFVDIGAMNWVPAEFKHHNDKQLVSFWWKQIVQKCPWADALSSKRRRKERQINQTDDDFKTHSPTDVFVVQELDFGSDL